MSLKPTSAVVYLRVSTDEQALHGMGLPAQEDACNQHAGRMGWDVRGIFRDEGVSASLPHAKRPGFLDAVAALERGDVLLVAKRDRIFRADPMTNAMIEQTVESRRARIVSVAGEGTEDDDPSSVLMRRMIDAFAEYERLLIAARTRAALRAKARRSERVGQVPIGRRLHDDGRSLLVDPAEEAAIGPILQWRRDGRSLRWIARELTAEGVPAKRGGRAWRQSTIHSLLRRIADGA